jgi:7-carboxy-7-deazaguanine synthase
VRFKVNEIFYSIQGEGSRAGRPCLFIRLTGCPLRCVYCDTTYAFHEGEMMELEAILAAARERLGPPMAGPNAPFVELTGGEPLAHPGAPALLGALEGLGYQVALETAGSHDLAPVPRSVVKIVDRKTPGSGEEGRWLESNLDFMVSGQDELKFVLCGPDDYQWA